MGVRVVDRVLDGGDFLRIFVGNLNTKFVFQSHDQFYGVKRISAQVSHKGFFAGELTFLKATWFGKELLNTC